MENKHGTCDWCKQFTDNLVRLDYVDGISNHSCTGCHDLAKIDVRQFNLAELALRAKQTRLN
ncbi:MULTISPECIES: hypothetical protein [Vibrio]|uniref:Uncharacterized protein n=1 Tax=Vibrio algicola TaxID=2662262 RepID=A0A5Q0TIG4_9VIBR|nr:MULTISPECIES: hypothetical protein [Vibrio]MBD1575699.1 hypothetical protein [Vibrio sp. S11_S32]